jgi:nitroreductase
MIWLVATDLAKLILSRHSVRDNFDRRAIPRDVLEEIIACGLSAPSSKAANPWRFHVVTNPDQLRSIADLALAEEGAERFVPKDPATGLPRSGLTSTVRESAEILQKVPAAIIVENLGKFSTSRSSVAQSQAPDMEDILLGYGFEMIGIGAAVENMWLAAHARGIEGVYMGDLLIAEEGIQSLLGIEHDLAGVLAIGYVTAEEPASFDLAFSGRAHVVWHESETDAGVDTRSGLPDVFISYRREKHLKDAKLISQYLTRANINCFLDVENIPPGAHWRATIERSMSSCKIVLVLMGKEFFKCYDEESGERRIDGDEDVVRQEIRLALDLAAQDRLQVIPLLLDGADMPKPKYLPGDIQGVLATNALSLRTSGNVDLQRLSEVILRALIH